MSLKVILSVTNDLYTDPRVDKVCKFLIREGFDVMLVGRCYHNSPKLKPREYQTKRMHLFFRKGALFYAEYNIRLFFLLLFHRVDILVANDLDTLLPTYIVSKMKHKPMIYDAHEYFCGLLSIIHRKKVLKIWHTIEKRCFPHLKYISTVSQSIANQYKEEYGKEVMVVRNIPPKTNQVVTESRSSLQLPENKTIILLQGNGINEGRGGEELVCAMQHLDARFILYIIGAGNVLPKLKQMTKELQLSDKICFINRVSPELLFNYTSLADVGVSLDRNSSPNLRFSLPNKIFEYIKAETPLIVSNLTERAAIINHYKVGIIVEELEENAIAEAIKKLVEDKELYALLKENCKFAANELTWENEEKVLKQLYTKVVEQNFA